MGILSNKNSVYSRAAFLKKLKSCNGKTHYKFAFLDIDGSLAGKSQEQKNARKMLEKRNYVVVFVTSRPEERLMSKKQYIKTKKINSFFTRPIPHMRYVDGKYSAAFPDEVHSYEGLFDPDIIASASGTRILVRQEAGGYITDTVFDEKLHKFPQSSLEWRKNTITLLAEIHQHNLLKDLEYTHNYLNGLTDEWPADFRIVATFTENKNNPRISWIEKRKEFFKKFSSIKKNLEIPDYLRKHVENIIIIDDSYPKERIFQAFLVPAYGGKDTAVDHIIKQLASHVKIKKNDLEVIFFGDGYPDLAMGLTSAKKTKAHFLLPGNSRLAHALTKDNNCWKLHTIKKKLHHHAEGIFSFHDKTHVRKILIGDLLYPGESSTQTLTSYLQDKGLHSYLASL